MRKETLQKMFQGEIGKTSNGTIGWLHPDIIPDPSYHSALSTWSRNCNSLKSKGLPNLRIISSIERASNWLGDYRLGIARNIAASTGELISHIFGGTQLIDKEILHSPGGGNVIQIRKEMKERLKQPGNRIAILGAMSLASIFRTLDQLKQLGCKQLQIDCFDISRWPLYLIQKYWELEGKMKYPGFTLRTFQGDLSMIDLSRTVNDVQQGQTGLITKIPPNFYDGLFMDILYTYVDNKTIERDMWILKEILKPNAVTLIREMISRSELASINKSVFSSSSNSPFPTRLQKITAHRARKLLKLPVSARDIKSASDNNFSTPCPIRNSTAYLLEVILAKTFGEKDLKLHAAVVPEKYYLGPNKEPLREFHYFAFSGSQDSKTHYN